MRMQTEEPIMNLEEEEYIKDPEEITQYDGAKESEGLLLIDLPV